MVKARERKFPKESHSIRRLSLRTKVCGPRRVSVTQGAWASRPPEFKIGARIGVLPLLLHSKSSAPHPAEPELPSARAELRALRSAARSAAASGGWSSAPCGAELFLFVFSCPWTRGCPQNSSLVTSSFKNQKSKFNIPQSTNLPPTKPIATSPRTTALQPSRIQTTFPQVLRPRRMAALLHAGRSSFSSSSLAQRLADVRKIRA